MSIMIRFALSCCGASAAIGTINLFASMERLEIVSLTLTIVAVCAIATEFFSILEEVRDEE